MSKKSILLGPLSLVFIPLQTFALHYQPFVSDQHKYSLKGVETKRLSGKDGIKEFSDVSPEIVVEEDFSRFVNGSEESPVPVELDGYYIPDNLTSQPGWTGRGIAEAGKACAIMYYNNDYYGKTTGFLDTPEMYLYGTVTLSFRAKVMNGSEGSIWVPLCDTYDGPLDSETFSLTDEWQTFTYSTNEATSYNNYFQFTPEDCEVLIDEVIVEVIYDKVKAPYTLLPENIDLTSFKAKWENAVVPDAFLLNVYSLEAPQNLEKGIVIASFNDINVIEGTDEINQTSPNYPDGWNITADYVTEGAESSVAILLDKEGQEIESPEIPLPVKELSFWVRPTNMNSESYEISLIQVSVFSTYWSAIANLPNYWLSPQGGFYSFESAAIGEGVSKIKISYLQEGSASVGFAIDDIQISYETPETKVPFISGKEVEGTVTEYIVEGIDPEKNYYYTVNAKIKDIVSPDSYPVWVDGIDGITPIALDAEDINDNGFTARWERLPHAENYKVKVLKYTTAEDFMEDVTVLEEDFDMITSGTLSNPGYDVISPFNFGANGMANSDWMATQPRWIEGMAGSDGTSWFGAAGIVASPYLILTNDGGAFDVEFSAMSIAQDDEIFCMIIDDIFATEALDSRSLQLGKALELGSTKIHFDEAESNRNNVMIAFMSKSGLRFFVDYVRISQNLLPGESLVSHHITGITDETSYKFDTLTDDSDYSYSVIATAYKDFVDYESKQSNEIRVQLYSGIEQLKPYESLKWNYDGNHLLIYGLKSGKEVGLYDTLGRKVDGSKITDEGSCRLSCPPGIYIIRTVSSSLKISLQ